MRFFAALLCMLLAMVLQFWFASAGIFIDFVFGALIAFAFVFAFWEIVFFVLLSLFVINWQPAASLTLGVFGGLPLLAYGFRKLFPWQAWAGNIIAMVLGLFILYLSVSPTLLFANWEIFFTDLLASLAFGSFVFFALRYSHRR